MKYLFWICWIIDAGVAAWWVISDMNLQYIRPNPYSFVFLLYVLVNLLIFLLSDYKKAALIMSLIPTIPLALMMLVIIIATLTGGKWN